MASIPAVSPPDLKNYADRVFARDKLVISVVGDIDAKTLGQVLDHAFGGLPAHAPPTTPQDARPAARSCVRGFAGARDARARRRRRSAARTQSRGHRNGLEP